MGMNLFICSGNLTRDPQFKQVGNNLVANFSIAVQRQFKNKQTGQYDTDFFNVAAWNGIAEFIQNYPDAIRKGTGVIVSGELFTNNYTTTNNQGAQVNVRSYQIRATSFEIQHNANQRPPRNQGFNPNQPNPNQPQPGQNTPNNPNGFNGQPNNNMNRPQNPNYNPNPNTPQQPRGSQNQANGGRPQGNLGNWSNIDPFKNSQPINTTGNQAGNQSQQTANANGVNTNVSANTQGQQPQGNQGYNQGRTAQNYNQNQTANQTTNTGTANTTNAQAPVNNQANQAQNQAQDTHKTNFDNGKRVSLKDQDLPF